VKVATKACSKVSQTSLAAVLEPLGLQHLASMFEQEQVDCEALRIMNDDDLKEMGIGKGPRMKLCRWIADHK
jgi:hypothetical protein